MYKKIYVAKTGFIKKEDVQSIGEFIERVKNRTPEKILSEIEKHPDHPIYAYVFNNSNEEAAHEYRISRVQWLIRQIVYKIDKKEFPVGLRLFYNVVNREGDNEYKTMEEVFKNPSYSNQVIESALNELRNWTERYKMYSKLKNLCHTIKIGVKKVKT